MTTKKDLPTMLQGWADAVRVSTCDLANPYALVLELGRAFVPKPKPKEKKVGTEEEVLRKRL